MAHQLPVFAVQRIVEGEGIAGRVAKSRRAELLQGSDLGPQTRDRPDIQSAVSAPLEDEDERRMLDRFTSVTRATLKGTAVIGVIQGGLAGAVPSDAFSVHVGLGDTMTAVDILEGILRITVLVAVVRPAEFIEITFQQQMQKS